MISKYFSDNTLGLQFCSLYISCSCYLFINQIKSKNVLLIKL